MNQRRVFPWLLGLTAVVIAACLLVLAIVLLVEAVRQVARIPAGVRREEAEEVGGEAPVVPGC